MSDIIDLKAERMNRLWQEDYDTDNYLEYPPTAVVHGVLLAGARAMATEFGNTPVVTALLAAAAELSGEILASPNEEKRKKLIDNLMANIWENRKS